jgi:indolepyruvate ferredoxin oxidoreductase alpha subunit
MTEQLSGAEFLARGAIDAGVSLVTGYPGSPATSVVNAILDLTTADEVQVEWTSNEKVALEIAFGASLAGSRSLLAVKGVGLNIALDHLMAINLSGCHAGLVILVGDDPGGWGSQNEQDSRHLAIASELPLLEPTSPQSAYSLMQKAFHLSETLGLPVILRITRALALAQEEALTKKAQAPLSHTQPLKREPNRWVVLPINVVPLHKRLLKKLNLVQEQFTSPEWNRIEGRGNKGILAAGFCSQKLLQAMGDIPLAEVSLFHLSTIYPLPEQNLLTFLQRVTSVLVLEETAPLVERAVRDLAQREKHTLPILGRDSDHLPRTGELLPPQIAMALQRYLPGMVLPPITETTRHMPSREPLCADCPYIPAFKGLLEVMEEYGGRDRFFIVGDPGCMVRGQLPPFELLDVKNSLGSSIGMAAGMACRLKAQGSEQQVIALSGDSGWLHTGIHGSLEAVRMGVKLLVVILDNGTTALSGGQPHPATSLDSRGQPRPSVDLQRLIRALQPRLLEVVNLDEGEDIRPALRKGIAHKGVAVVLSRGRCTYY